MISLIKSILFIVFAAFATLVVNVLTHVLFMVIYTHTIDTGKDQAYYQSLAESTAPYSSFIAGAPIMFAICYWAAKRFSPGFRFYAALLIWFVYFLIDLSVIAGVGQLSNIGLLFAISFTTKFAAAALAGWLAGRSAK